MSRPSSRVSRSSALGSLPWALGCAAWLLSPPAGAEQPKDARESDESGASSTELTVLPIVGGDSDVGIGGGVIASLARVEPNLEPYLWRLEGVGSATVLPRDGEYQVRYVDVYLLLALPHLIRDELGLNLRVSYTKESDLSYYGLGNGAELVPGLGLDHPYYSYDWTHPKVELTFENQLGKGFELVAGLSYTYNQVDIPLGGKLAEDAESPVPEVRQRLRLVPSYGVFSSIAGLNWDTRDDEVAPEGGHYHSLRLDYSPSVGSELPFAWGRANLVLRQYVSLWPGRLVFAGRLIGDALFGEPPFYELARIDNTFAIGGTRGVRGVPSPRYYGMVKLLANLELRARLFSFDLFGKSNDLGVVAFTDLGRVVADYSALSGLDGDGLGAKVAFGGGLRVRAGKSFVLRLDVAGSPQEDSVSAYLAAGHLF